jgi:hypothetical protein
MAATSSASATWKGRMPGIVATADPKFQLRFLGQTVSSAFDA